MTAQRSSFLRWQRSALGVDLQPGRMVVVEARRSGRRLTWAELDAAEAGVRSRLQSGGACAAASLSVRQSFARWVEAPFHSLRKARRVLPSLLDLQLPFPLEECAYEFVELRRMSTGRAGALVVAARRQEVERQLEGLRGAGVDPAILDQEGLALWSQSLREMPCAAPERHLLRAVVYAAADRAALVIGTADRYLDSHAVKLQDAGHAARLVRAHLAGAGGLRWCLAGPAVDGEAARSALTQRLQAEAPGAVSVHDSPGSFLARALAVRALTGEAEACNLRQGALAHPAAVAAAARGRARAALVAAAAGAVLCAANLAAEARLRHHRQAADRAVVELATGLAGHSLGGARGEDALRVVRTALDRRRESLQPYVDAFAPSLTAELAEIAAQGQRAKLRLELLRLEPRALHIAGLAPDWTGCDALVQRLQQRGREVTLKRQEALPDQWIPFVIQQGGGDE